MSISEYSVTGEIISTDRQPSDANFANWYPPIKGMRWNYVIHKYHEPGTNSDLSSNPIDRAILQAIRKSSDLIITSGRTAKAEQLRASKFAPMLIITRDSTLEIPATSQESENDVFIAGPQSSQAFPNSKANTVALEISDLPNWLSTFIDDFDSVVLESGVSLAKEILAADLVKELDITVSSANTFAEAFTHLETFMTLVNVSQRVIQVLKADESWFFRCAVAQ